MCALYDASLLSNKHRAGINVFVRLCEVAVLFQGPLQMDINLDDVQETPDKRMLICTRADGRCTMFQPHEGVVTCAQDCLGQQDDCDREAARPDIRCVEDPDPHSWRGTLLVCTRGMDSPSQADVRDSL